MSENTETAGALGIITERDVPATMRDGVTLRADIFRPDGDGVFPGLLLRTPYGKYRKGRFDRFVRAGYAVMVQDTRGRYTSDGDWISNEITSSSSCSDRPWW